jgi:uncharacterized protein YgbK (DUF1537 family)
MIEEPYLNLRDVFDALPQEYPLDLTGRLDKELKKLNKVIVVLDDDPTGTQTVHDVIVLTSWEVADIKPEFEAATDIFYILTNSRSLTAPAADQLAEEIGKNLLQSSKETGRDFLVISRSDSTLRGHYPNEVDALASVIDHEDAIRFFVPAFFEGGRFTINDVHYVQEKDNLIPASETPFAKDRTFGFEHSNLKAYVEEKTGGKIRASEVHSISIEELRTSITEQICQKIKSIPKGAVCIVNAVSYQDLSVFALAMLQSGRKVILRTAASIVPVLAGISKKPLLNGTYFQQTQGKGILAVVGSYVPKTTAQLEQLRHLKGIHFLEIDVTKVLEQGPKFEQEISDEIDQLVSVGKDVVVYTSRLLVADQDPKKSLMIGQKVSVFITMVVQALKIQPKAILAKGGITSSDVATKGLGVKRALVAGQVSAGVPVWKLGEEAKFPGLNYIVFPGNVGTESTLQEVFLKVRGS